MSYNFIGTIIVFCFVTFMIAKAIIESHDYNSFNPWQAQIWFKLYHWKKWLKEKLLEWREWWKNLTGLKKIYFILAIFATIMLAYSLYSVFPKFIQEIAEMRASLSDLSLAVFACLSGIGAVFGFYTSIIRTETGEQGLITDRINKAIEGLGRSNQKDEPVIEVRLGALYALERIAQDSMRDHIQIMEIICAYVRHNSPSPRKLSGAYDPTESEGPDDFDGPFDIIRLREDIDSAVNIIGRRGNWPNGKKRLEKEQKQKYYIDLSYCNLHAAQLNYANLSGAILTGTNLSGASLANADLSNTDISYAYLHHANLLLANLEGANLDEIFLHSAIITNANLRDASLNGANLERARINNSDLSGAFLYRAELNYARLSNAKLNRACLEKARMYKTSFFLTKMSRAYAYKADFSNCENLTRYQLAKMYCGKNVKISDNLERPKHWLVDELSWDAFYQLYRDWTKKPLPQHPDIKEKN